MSELTLRERLAAIEKRHAWESTAHCAENKEEPVLVATRVDDRGQVIIPIQLTTPQPPAKVDKRGCLSCKEKLLARMKEQIAKDAQKPQDHAQGFAGGPRMGEPVSTARVDISLIINTSSESYRVRATIESFREWFAKAGLIYEFVVVDDGSTDGCCDNLGRDVVVIRHDPRKGCGQSKYEASEKATGRVLMWVDAHQSPFEGDIAKAVAWCGQNEAILAPASCKLNYVNKKPVRMGKAIFAPDDTGVGPRSVQYRGVRPVEHGTLTKILMVPVGLMMSRATYERVGGWNRYPAELGSQERGMSLKAFMSNTPVMFDPSIIIGHEYSGADASRAKRPYTINGAKNHALNAWYAFRVVLGDEGFEAVKPLLLSCRRTCKGPGGEKSAFCEEQRAHFAKNCKRMVDADLVKMLATLQNIDPAKDKQLAGPEDPMEGGGAVAEPFFQWLIASRSKGRVLDLGTGSGNDIHYALSGGRVKEVVSVDHTEKWTKAAATRFAADSRVKCLCLGEKKAIPSPKYIFDERVSGLFDTIIFDGPPGTAARKACIEDILRLLAPDGIIIVDDFKRDGKLFTQDRRFKVTNVPTHRGAALVSRSV